MLTENFPAYVRTIRHHRQITQIMASMEIGVSLQTVRLVEQGLNPKRADVVRKFTRWVNNYKHVIPTVEPKEPEEGNAAK